MVLMRVPYPMGFYAKGLDARIDDPNAGWKGRGLWSASGDRTPWLNEARQGRASDGGADPGAAGSAGEVAQEVNVPLGLRHSQPQRISRLGLGTSARQPCNNKQEKTHDCKIVPADAHGHAALLRRVVIRPANAAAVPRRAGQGDVREGLRRLP